MVGDHEGWRAITFRNAHHAIFFFGPRATTVPVTGVTAMHLLDHTRWYYYVCVVCVCVHCALDLALIWHRDIRYGAAPTLTHRNTRKCARFEFRMGGMWAGAKLTCLLNMSLLLYTTCLAWPQPDFPTKSMCNWMRGAQAIRWCGVMMGQTHISCADASFGDFGMAWWGGKESDRYERPAPSAQRCKWRQQHHHTQTTQTAEHNAQCTHGYSV